MTTPSYHDRALEDRVPHTFTPLRRTAQGVGMRVREDATPRAMGRLR